MCFLKKLVKQPWTLKRKKRLLNIQKCLSQPDDVIMKSALKAHLKKLQEKIEMAYLANKRQRRQCQKCDKYVIWYLVAICVPSLATYQSLIILYRCMSM